jgi:hypothetical protein
MNSADSFSADYPSARAKFRQAVGDAGGSLETFAHPERGPDGDDLSTDVALIGPAGAERFLVMISGTHGGEGFCGSGAQIDWLRRGEASRLPSGLAVLMIHAINPYGFAWLRRVTEDNVDLNRNWIDFSAPLPANAGYDALAGAIVPKTWTDAAQRESADALADFAREQGPMGLQQALSGGQYKHPTGIFFGGAGPTWSRRTQTAIFETWLGGAGRVGIIDYHTGLGPWGYGEQIITDAPPSTGYERARAWYGAAITCPAAGTSTSADQGRRPGRGAGASASRQGHGHGSGGGGAVSARDPGGPARRRLVARLRRFGLAPGQGDQTRDARRLLRRRRRLERHGCGPVTPGLPSGDHGADGLGLSPGGPCSADLSC